MTRSTLHIFVALCTTACALVVGASASAQGGRASVPAVFVLDSVVVERSEPIDSAAWYAFLNELHSLTREHVIAEELFIATGDTVTSEDLAELERNLRSLEIFSRVSLELVPVDDGRVRGLPRRRLVIRTRDAYTLRTGGSLSTAGDDLTVYGSVRETSLFGSGTQLGFSAEHTSIDGRGWRVTGSALDPNVAGTHIRLGIGGATSGTEKSVRALVDMPYYSTRSTNAFSVTASYADFDENFFYPWRTEGVRFAAPTRTVDALGWYSLGRREKGSLFSVSAGIQFDRTQRDTLPSLPRAFENTVAVLAGVHSLKRVWARLSNADFSGDRLVPIGGMGSVTLGKISPHGGGLDNMAYVGGEARQAAWLGRAYTYVSAAAATGLASKRATFTIQKLSATAWLPLGYGAIAARVDESTVWNWPRYVFLSIDNATGLRGYDFLSHSGNNRLATSVEYRVFPMFRVSAFDLGVDVGATAFYDLGTVWNQGESIGSARFHSSAGLGLRFSNALGVFDRALLRLDVAYNFEERRISRLILSTQESFDAFGSLEFRPPVPYQP